MAAKTYPGGVPAAAVPPHSRPSLEAMVGWRGGVLAAMFASACGCCCADAQEHQSGAVPCGGETVARGTVSRIIDGRTFVLDDGREVRLAGIEVPSLLAPGGAGAKDALDALTGGDDVVLRRAEIPKDRYGRLVGYAYAVRDGDELFTQGEMISSGFARVGGDVGIRACSVDLLGREGSARRAKLGLWADSYYVTLHAETPAEVLAQRGRFALVEGRVVSVRESGATIYVNFGRRWSEDFAVTILKRNARRFAAAGLDVQGLAGRRVRVRGWIEERGAGGSPHIEADHPEQIEVDDRN